MKVLLLAEAAQEFEDAVVYLKEEEPGLGGRLRAEIEAHIDWIIENPTIPRLREGATLLASGCLSWEIGNAFSAILKRKRMNFELVSKGLAIFEMIPIQEMEVSLADGLALSNRHEIYAYDAYYLQLAKRTSLPRLTLDRRMIEVA